MQRGAPVPLVLNRKLAVTPFPILRTDTGQGAGAFGSARLRCSAPETGKVLLSGRSTHMKRVPLMLVIASVFPFALAAGSPMTALERQRIAAHLEMTGAWLPDEVSNLSPAQLRFRPAPGAWNILEVVEHLAISSPIYWTQLHEAMKKPPGPFQADGHRR